MGTPDGKVWVRSVTLMCPPCRPFPSSCPAGRLPGALPHQVHRDRQPEDLPRVQLGLRPGLGRDYLLLRRGRPLLPQPQELRRLLLKVLRLLKPVRV